MLMGTVEKSIQSFQGLQLQGDQSKDPMMGGSSDPLSQTLESVTGSLGGPLSGLLMPGGASMSMAASSSTMSSSTMMPSATSSMSSSSMMTSSMSTPTAMATPSAAPASGSEGMSGGSPSGISLSSGDDTLGSILKPITGLLQGAGGATGGLGGLTGSLGGGSTAMPAKRALAFKA